MKELAWNRQNVRKVRRHGGSVRAAEEVFAGQPKFFEQGEKSTAMMIGPDSAGRFWTVVIAIRGERGIPITMWPSKARDVHRYEES